MADRLIAYFKVLLNALDNLWLPFAMQHRHRLKKTGHANPQKMKCWEMGHAVISICSEKSLKILFGGIGCT